MRRTAMALTSVVLGVGFVAAIAVAGNYTATAHPTTAPAVRVERIDTGAKRCKKTAAAIRTLLALRDDAGAFVVGEDAPAGCILLSGPPSGVEDLVRVLGVRSKTIAGGATRRPPDVVTRVLTLDQTSSKSVSRTIRDAFRREPALNVAVNEERNAIVLRGEPAIVSEAERIVHSLDGGNPADEELAVTVVPLRHTQVAYLSLVVKKLLGDRCGVTPDQRTNSLIIQCAPERLERITKTVESLDNSLRPWDPQLEMQKQRRRGEWKPAKPRNAKPAPRPKTPKPSAPPPSPQQPSPENSESPTRTR